MISGEPLVGLKSAAEYRDNLPDVNEKERPSRNLAGWYHNTTILCPASFGEAKTLMLCVKASLGLPVTSAKVGVSPSMALRCAPKLHGCGLARRGHDDTMGRTGGTAVFA